MGKHQRDKGQRFERKVAEALRDIWPDAQRGFQYRGGDDTPDVEGCIYRVECKHYKRIAVMRWWDKAMEDCKEAGDTRDTIIVFKEDRGPIMVMQPLEDWLEWVASDEVKE